MNEHQQFHHCGIHHFSSLNGVCNHCAVDIEDVNQSDGCVGEVTVGCPMCQRVAVSHGVANRPDSGNAIIVEMSDGETWDPLERASLITLPNGEYQRWLDDGDQDPRDLRIQPGEVALIRLFINRARYVGPDDEPNDGDEVAPN